MIFSVVAIVSLLSLLSFTGAAAVNARDGVCHTFTCPDADNLGEGLNPGSSNDGKVISCSYGTTAVVECKYDAYTGSFTTGKSTGGDQFTGDHTTDESNGDKITDQSNGGKATDKSTGGLNTGKTTRDVTTNKSATEVCVAKAKAIC